MGVSCAVRVVIVGAAVLLAGCGIADEARLTASAATTTSLTPESSASDAASGSGSAESVGTSVGEAVPPTDTSASVPTADSVPTAASAGTVTGATGSSPAVEVPDADTVVPSITASPGTFPDREEVEAQGVAANPLCEVLSTDEVTALLGVPVRPAADAAAGTGCLWSSEASGDSYLQLQLVGDPARYAPPAGAESLSGIGDVAAVAVADGVWTAQAQNPDGTFAVQLAGPTASRDGAVEGLRRLLERY